MPRDRRPRVLAALVAVLALAAGLTPAAGAASGDPVDPQQEAANFAKQGERAQEYLAPGDVSDQATQGADHCLGGQTEQAGDPERLFLTDLCWSKSLACGGDPRLAHWQQDGHGLVRTVLFTARNGATLSGHVWATRRGPAHRPLVVITPGSVQATEQMYWWAAQTLAKDGYVVLTRDAQNQGRSDTFGAGGDRMDGVPAQTTGVTFYDHTQDALDFALSRPGHRYCPRQSRSGTSHCDKQRRRVAAGLATPYNPFWRLVDRTRVGLAGHSYGASGTTWVAQQDHRVDAAVAWDNLCDLSAPTRVTPAPGGNVPSACLTGGLGHPRPRVPSLGLSADYGLTPTPYTTRPDPEAKSVSSREFSKAGVDTGELVIRGGTHFEFSYIPLPLFGATLRGIDLSAWYTAAWFDYYVKGDRSALRRLLTTRWRHDAPEAAVDPSGDGNLFSAYYRSRLDLGHDGGPRVRCENLRAGCRALGPRDGWRGGYSYYRIATSPDRR
jgi:dienelactone hydrolase